MEVAGSLEILLLIAQSERHHIPSRQWHQYANSMACCSQLAVI